MFQETVEESRHDATNEGTDPVLDRQSTFAHRSRT
jgi:hypothetical protein